ncbi:50S ribosomal protein L22 [Candidatus Woesearchaeota archaeon]|nr:50S ribosomal protein L22 [Candidatus Woesearchaeota archaeon]
MSKMKGYTSKNYNREHMARAIGMALPISFKQSVEICRFIKNKNISNAKEMLQDVVSGKRAVPFKKFDFDLGHKKKIGPGRYPQKASKEFIRLIGNVEANAQFKGLNTSNLIIAHISAHKAGKTWHFGRKSRRRMKRTNVEIVVEEKASKTEVKEGTKTKAAEKTKKQ